MKKSGTLCFRQREKSTEKPRVGLKAEPERAARRVQLRKTEKHRLGERKLGRGSALLASQARSRGAILVGTRPRRRKGASPDAPDLETYVREALS